ncbi:MAG: hypothetical protein ACE5GE_06825 [Phycisphaerae bacterium]
MSIVVIYSWYFLKAFRLYDAGQAGSLVIVLLFVGAVVAQIIVQIVAHAVFAVKSEPQARDERDIEIELKSLKYSHLVLSIGVMLSVLGIVAREVVSDAGGPTLQVTPFVLGHGLLLFFVVAEVLYYGTQVFHYRRGV